MPGDDLCHRYGATKKIVDGTFMHQVDESGTHAMNAPWTGKALMIVAAVLVVLEAASAAGGLQAQLFPAQSVTTAQCTVMGTGTAHCERMKDVRRRGAVAGRGCAIYQAWVEPFLAALSCEQPSRQLPAVDQIADVQCTLLLRHCLFQPDDLFVHAVAAPAIFLNRVTRIARVPYPQRREVRHE